MSRQTFLNAERQRKRAQREFEKIEKKEQQSRNTCKSCGRYWKGGPGWKECESCSYYSRCSKCSLNPLPMKEHEKNCKKIGRKNNFYFYSFITRHGYNRFENKSYHSREQLSQYIYVKFQPYPIILSSQGIFLINEKNWKPTLKLFYLLEKKNEKWLIIWTAIEKLQERSTDYILDFESTASFTISRLLQPYQNT